MGNPMAALHEKLESGAQGPLTGLKVVEFASIGPGPFAAMMLADMGAEVVRVSRPGSPTWKPEDFVRRGRTELQLDLKKPEDVQTAAELAGAADVVLEGNRPGVMERLGLGPDVLLASNPRLVYGRMTGWGQSGPLSTVAGHDINYIALSGALHSIGSAARPYPPLNLAGDYGGGALFLVCGLLAALLQVRSGGPGQIVDAAMCDGSASLMTQFFSSMAKGEWHDARESNMLDGGAHFYGTYECSDGKFIAIGAIEPQFYSALREKMQLHDTEFDLQHDRSRWPSLRAKLAQVVMQKSRDEWCAILEGLDTCVSPVLSLSEAPAHAHLMNRDTLTAAFGCIQPAPAPRFSATPSSIRPSKQQSAESILAHWARAPL